MANMVNGKVKRPGGFLRRWRADRRGSYAVIFALALVPILIAIGAAVDVSKAYVVKQRLTRALDAAGLAVGGTTGMTTAQIQTTAQNFFNANYPASKVGVPGALVVSTSGNVVNLSVTAAMPTSVMGIVGLNNLDIHASSQITRMGRNLEVALVLDNTGSMAGSKIADLKEAAADLIDVVVQDSQSPYYSKVAIVPYSVAVNVGDYADQVRGEYSPGTCTSPGCARYRFRNSYGWQETFSISTCVTERTGADAYTATAPNVAPLGMNYPSPSNSCIKSTILPLTNDKATLKSRINDMSAGGSTGGHIGVAWGWYMLSPSFNYLWPAASAAGVYNPEKLLKAVVIMTDGEYNSAYCNGVISQDSLSGSGSASDHINCDAPNGDVYTQAKALCTNMKAAGVIVYTVGFDIGNAWNAKSLLSTCATDPSHMYLPKTGADLKAAFGSIAQGISNLRVSQ